MRRFASRLRRQRRAAVYIVVLLASMIVAAMALASVETMRWYAKSLNDNADAFEVRMAAEAGLELAIAQINADPDWRTNYQHDQDSATINFSGCNLVFRLRDEDADLKDDLLDFATLIVTASRGDHRFSWQARLAPDGDPLECLQYAIAANRKIEAYDYSAISSNQALTAKDGIQTSNSGYITADCASEKSVSGNVYGTISSLPSALPIPDKDILQYYQDHGTEIPLTDIPLNNGVYTIENQLLSPSSNTINGTVDPGGVYFIDCSDQEFRISNSRFLCTLVLIKPKNGSVIAGSMHWEAAQANYPILLVEGEMLFELSQGALSEADTLVNFNPAGTPYRGASDTDTATVYPSLLRGLVYVSKKVEFSNYGGKNRIDGCLVVRDHVRTTGDLFMNYRDVYWRNPPPGFQSSSEMKIVSGSLQRVSPP